MCIKTRGKRETRLTGRNRGKVLGTPGDVDCMAGVPELRIFVIWRLSCRLVGAQAYTQAWELLVSLRVLASALY